MKTKTIFSLADKNHIENAHLAIKADIAKNIIAYAKEAFVEEFTHKPYVDLTTEEAKNTAEFLKLVNINFDQAYADSEIDQWNADLDLAKNITFEELTQEQIDTFAAMSITLDSIYDRDFKPTFNAYLNVITKK